MCTALGHGACSGTDRLTVPTRMPYHGYGAKGNRANTRKEGVNGERASHTAVLSTCDISSWSQACDLRPLLPGPRRHTTFLRIKHTHTFALLTCLHRVGPPTLKAGVEERALLSASCVMLLCYRSMPPFPPACSGTLPPFRCPTTALLAGSNRVEASSAHLGQRRKSPGRCGS
jgi:hypothetical protein